MGVLEARGKGKLGLLLWVGQGAELKAEVKPQSGGGHGGHKRMLLEGKLYSG